MKLDNKIAAITAVAGLINTDGSTKVNRKALQDLAAVATGPDATVEDQQAIAGLVALARPDMLENIKLFSETVETYLGDASPEFKQQILFTMMDIHYGLA